MKKYFRNSAFGVLQFLFSMLIVFFSIPIFIKSYGLSLYGLFSVISIFGNLNALFNLGLNTTLLKFISLDSSDENKNRQVNVAMIILLTITVSFTILIFLLRSLIIDNLIKDQPSTVLSINLSFSLFLLANFLMMMGQPLVALIQANNDFYRTSIFQFIYGVLNGTGLIIFSLLKINFQYIALPSLFATIFWFLVLTIYSIRRYNYRVTFLSKEVFVSTAREQLKYSVKVYATSILSFFNEPLLKIIVARFIGIEAVGRLDIVLKFKGQLVGLLVKVFEPLSTAIASKHNVEDLRKIIHYFERAALMVFIPICFMIFLLSDFALKQWMQDIDSNLIVSIKITVILFIGSMSVLPNFYFLTFHNHIKDCMRIQSSGVLISIVLFFSLKGTFPSAAPIVSVCGSIISGFVYNLYFQNKYLNSLIFNKNSLHILIKLIVLLVVFSIAYIAQILAIQIATVLLITFVCVSELTRLLKNGSLNILEVRSK